MIFVLRKSDDIYFTGKINANCSNLANTYLRALQKKSPNKCICKSVFFLELLGASYSKSSGDSGGTKANICG